MSNTEQKGPQPAQQQHDKPLKKRAVVSSFLFKFPDGGPSASSTRDGKKPLVALFRRSGLVSTYRQVFQPLPPIYVMDYLLFNLNLIDY